MFGGSFPREHTIADHASAHVLTDDDEHLADLVGALRVRALPNVFVSGHVSQSMSHERISFVTSVPRLDSTAERQLNQQLELAAVRTLRHQHVIC